MLFLVRVIHLALSTAFHLLVLSALALSALSRVVPAAQEPEMEMEKLPWTLSDEMSNRQPLFGQPMGK